MWKYKIFKPGIQDIWQDIEQRLNEDFQDWDFVCQIGDALIFKRQKVRRGKLENVQIPEAMYNEN